MTYTIIKPHTTWYSTITMRERRYNTNYYFNQFNRWEILPRWLKEDKMFNMSDIYYIEQMRKWVKR